MRSKRQPTIKTLLLTTGVAGALCAVYTLLSRFEWRGPAYGHPVQYSLAVAMVSEGIFWLVLPLTLGIFIASPQTVGRTCFGIALVCFALNVVVPKYIDLLLGYDRIETEMLLLSALFGPLLFFEIVAAAGSHLFSDSIVVFLVIHALWIACYTFLGFQVALSCQLREQSATEQAAAE